MATGKEKSFFDAMESDIMNSKNIPESEKAKLMQNFLLLKEQKVNILITGATGCGKSSTINALFNTEVAKVGVGTDPETMDITKYELKNLILWDSPGLGDGKTADERHAKNIIKKLNEVDKDGNLLIDLVLVILDGSTRDLGTSYELINQVIVPNLGKDKENRILVAINQADAAMKGKHWNSATSQPDSELVKFLNDKAASVQKRIKEATGITINPIYYSAGFKEAGMPQERPYNLIKLFDYIIRFTPKKKRLVVMDMDNINQDKAAWRSDDGRQNYRRSIIENIADIGDTVALYASVGASDGSAAGARFGKVGEFVGGVIGGVGGAVEGLGQGIKDAMRCYITTATCEAYGKPDDCYELTTFRAFRDGWLKAQSDGQALIDRYYATAPQIVELINQQPNRADIYQHLNDTYLTPCLSYIEQGENEKCKATYVAMMEHLYQEQNKWQ